MKQCSHCKKRKELSAFAYDKGNEDKKQNVCRVCKKRLKAKAKEKVTPRKMKHAAKVAAFTTALAKHPRDPIGAYHSLGTTKNRQTASNGLNSFLATIKKDDGGALQKVAKSREAVDFIMKYIMLSEQVADATGDLSPMAWTIKEIIMPFYKTLKVDIPETSRGSAWMQALAQTNALLEADDKKEEDVNELADAACD